jgi:hypothetical protein
MGKARNWGFANMEQMSMKEAPYDKSYIYNEAHHIGDIAICAIIMVS